MKPFWPLTIGLRNGPAAAPVTRTVLRTGISTGISTVVSAVIGTGMILTLLWGCSGSSSKSVYVRREIATYDRKMDWAMVYYQSWRRDKDGLYLQMARRAIVDAVNSYFQLQVKMGHSYPDFYIVDRKRRRGCRFLDQMEREAGRFNVMLEEADQSGCLR